MKSTRFLIEWPSNVTIMILYYIWLIMKRSDMIWKS